MPCVPERQVLEGCCTWGPRAQQDRIGQFRPVLSRHVKDPTFVSGGADAQGSVAPTICASLPQKAGAREEERKEKKGEKKGKPAFESTSLLPPDPTRRARLTRNQHGGVDASFACVPQRQVRCWVGESLDPSLGPHIETADDALQRPAALAQTKIRRTPRQRGIRTSLPYTAWTPGRGQTLFCGWGFHLRAFGWLACFGGGDWRTAQSPNRSLAVQGMPRPKQVFRVVAWAPADMSAAEGLPCVPTKKNHGRQACDATPPPPPPPSSLSQSLQANACFAGCCGQGRQSTVFCCEPQSRFFLVKASGAWGKVSDSAVASSLRARYLLALDPKSNASMATTLVYFGILLVR
ncbi:hypothetical protein LX36DRAFT_29971 [Colletotrichum falcatum]|nr:hypothetical protein LX36DRAFT_29971 [Colletotrichum falcatum]